VKEHYLQDDHSSYCRKHHVVTQAILHRYKWVETSSLIMIILHYSVSQKSFLQYLTLNRFHLPQIMNCLYEAFTVSSNFPIGSRLSIAAITVAVCALVISLSQLLEQYFENAEGCWQCQSSFLSPWAKLTRLRWRWSRFRFETLLTTPGILLVPFHIDQNQQRIVWTSPGDRIECISGFMTISPRTKNKNVELTSWLPFLGDLHHKEWKLQRLEY